MNDPRSRYLLHAAHAWPVQRLLDENGKPTVFGQIYIPDMKEHPPTDFRPKQ